jgi:hypothetical protein
MEQSRYWHAREMSQAMHWQSGITGVLMERECMLLKYIAYNKGGLLTEQELAAFGSVSHGKGSILLLHFMICHSKNAIDPKKREHIIVLFKRRW